MSLTTDKLELKVEEGQLATQNFFGSLPKIVRWVMIFCLVVAIPAYFLAKNLSYNYWLSRYLQTVPVGKPSFTDAKAPTQGDVIMTTLGNNTYAAAVKVTNPNLDLSATDIPYTFNFYNADKQAIKQFSGSLFLLPNQQKYIVQARIETSEPVAYANFQIIDGTKIVWKKKLYLPEVNLQTTIPNSYNQQNPAAFVVEGQVINNSAYNLKKVRLTFLVYDQNDQIIGISQRDEFTVTAFERRAYKQLWPNLVAYNVKKIQVYADTNTLDPQNLTASDVGSGSAGDLTRPPNNRSGF